jgi:hypothetical protein
VQSLRALVRAAFRGGSAPASLIAAAGAILQILHWARSRPLWLDEQMIALNVRDRGLQDLAGELWLGQTAPLGWLVLQRLLLLLFGTGEMTLRVLPLLFGIGTIATAWWIGRRWLDPLSAALLVLLCSAAPWLVYHNLELKPYSADAFWSLFLPALAAWAADASGNDSAQRSRRIVWWWAAAATGQWFAYGALLVTPGCALVLVAAYAWRRGWRGVVDAGGPGLGWLAIFGLNYALALRHTSGSAYLHTYWASAMPPAAASAADTIRWLLDQLPPLALKPAGATTATLFWIAVVAGLALLIRWQPPLGAAMALVPLSAFLLAGLRLVPLYERLTLWMVPALYVGVAALAHAAVRFARLAYAARRATWLAPAIVCLLTAAATSVEICRNGWSEVDISARKRGNHELDDRATVRWLMSQHRDGDVLVTTHLGLPAVWWYGNLPMAGEGTRRTSSGAVEILEASHVPAGPNCHPTALADAVSTHRRVLVHLGFRFDDVPKHFDDLLMDRLSTIGSVTEYRSFTGRSRAGIVDLTRAPDRPQNVGGRSVPQDDTFVRSVGCIAVQPATGW